MPARRSRPTGNGWHTPRTSRAGTDLLSLRSRVLRAGAGRSRRRRYAARWAHSGRELFFEAPSGDMMMVMPVTPGPTFAPGAPQRVFPLGSGLLGSNVVPLYDVTPDDKRFVMVRLAAVSQAPGAGQLVMVENWFDELQHEDEREAVKRLPPPPHPRPLSAARTDRRRRHGRSVEGTRRQARSHVAVKMLLRGALGGSTDTRERFRREALTLSRLSHRRDRDGVRLRLRGRSRLPRHGVRAGRHARVPAARGSAAARADPIARRRGRRRAGGRAPPRRPSSRPEAGECCADDGGAAEDPGLRPRAAPGQATR